MQATHPVLKWLQGVYAALCKFQAFLSGKISMRAVSLAFAALFVLSLIPLFITGQYARPQVDDFVFGEPTRLAFLETGSLWEVLKAAASHMVFFYGYWQGTFSALFLFNLQPAIFGDGFYAVTPYIMLLALIAGVIFFCHTLFTKTLHATGWESLFIAVFVLFFYVQTPPSAVEAYFWYNGAIYYTFFTALAFFELALVLQLSLRKKTSSKVVLCTLTGLLAFFIGGGNFVTALAVCLLLCFLTLLAILQKQKVALFRGVITACHLCGLLLSVFSPGNAGRQSLYENTPSLLRAVVLSFGVAFELPWRWLNLIVLVLLLLLVPVFWRVASAVPFSFRAPLLVTLGSLCLLAAAVYPPMYTLGGTTLQAGRLFNAAYFLFIPLVVGNLFYWVGWACKRLSAQKTPGQDPVASVTGFFRRNVLLGLVCVLVTAAALSFVSGRYATYSSFLACHSIQNGVLQDHAHQMQQRSDLLNDPSVRVVQLEPLRHRLPLLFYHDYDDPQWALSTADYYGKDLIEVLPPETEE